MNSFTIRHIALVFLFHFLITRVYAQTEIRHSANQVVPPSPNVSAFQQYINYPVQLSTGVPQITIPIYTINLNGFNYPIALSYHASGVKVGEIASDVGLGWSLSANGAVNVNANGLMDDFSGQFIGSPKIKTRSFSTGYAGTFATCTTLGNVLNETLPYQNLLAFFNDGDAGYLRSVIYGQADTEPDLYTYFTATSGGKFFKDEYGIFRTIPASDNKIEQILDGNSAVTGYRITDNKGIIYFFELMNQTNSVTSSGCGIPGSNGSDTRLGREYYLTRINLPQGGEMDFHYAATAGYSYQLPIQSTRAYYVGANSSDYNTAPGGGAYNCSTSTTVNDAPFQLTSITTTNGTIVSFVYANTYRRDLPANGGRALQNIVVSNTGSSANISYNFFYDYFNGQSSSPNPDDYHLKLTGVQRNGEPPHQFTYNTTPGLLLPNRLSTSIDHYGYYNGQPNSSLLPADGFNGFPTGGDRSSHSDYVQADILTQIKYPTGGYVQYTYEPNTYWMNSNTIHHEYFTGNGINSVANQVVSRTFTVPPNAYQFTIHYEDTFDGTNQNVDECRIKLTDPNGTTREYLGTNYLTGLLLSTNGPALSGQYTVSIETIGNTYSADAYFTWYEQNTIPPHNETGGGVRISQIKSFSANDQVAFQKKYEYIVPGTDRSSGVNTFEPVYLDFKTDNKYIQNFNNNGACANVVLQANVQSSNSINPLLTSDGYSVSYSDVTEYDVDKTQNGYTHYLYNSDNSSNAAQVLSYPYAPLINYDWVKGDLLEADTYSYLGGTYKLVHKLTNLYNYNSFNDTSPDPNLFAAYGAKVGMTQPPTYCNTCDPSNPGRFQVPISSIQYGIEYYQYYSSWHYQTQSQETSYDLLGNNPVTTTRNFYYDNPTHLQLTRTVTTNSNGKILTMNNAFADDYASGSSFIDDMKAKHIIGLPIERVSYLDEASGTRIIDGEVTQYQPGGKGLTDKVYRLKTATPILRSAFKFSGRNKGDLPYGTVAQTYKIDTLYEEKLTYNGYDNAGNPLQITPFNNASTTYLWGYNGMYPIAEIKNATYFQVLNVLGQSTIDQLYAITGTDSQVRDMLSLLRTDPRLKDAQVTVFTYAPLVGMTSKTDPKGTTTYYEYDSLQRPRNVRDKDINIIKHNEYHFQGQ